MSDIAIRVNGLGKRYYLGGRRERYKALRDVLADSVTTPFRRVRNLLQGHATGAAELHEEFWALKDITFDIRHGEVTGIIGRNGAGKSTLLKILSRITQPTTGWAEVNGRVGSLLEVGTGFHPELTGRENIYLNGAILGMRKTEIGQKFDEIVDFAEIEKFLDTPVKHYSSGMYVRLAFAVAAHVEPEILLVDEVLAVGDIAFQKKCLGKIGDVAKGGRTVLFVSHNMGTIAQLCNRALWLNSARLEQAGPTSPVISSYLSSGISANPTWVRRGLGRGNADAEMRYAQVLSADSKGSSVIEFAKGFSIKIGYEVINPVRNLSAMCRLVNEQGSVIWTSWDTDTTQRNGSARQSGQYESICSMPAGFLRPGRYFVSVGLGISNIKVLDYYENVLSIDISEVGYTLNTNRIGIFTPLLPWRVNRLGMPT